MSQSVKGSPIQRNRNAQILSFLASAESNVSFTDHAPSIFSSVPSINPGSQNLNINSSADPVLVRRTSLNKKELKNESDHHVGKKIDVSNNSPISYYSTLSSGATGVITPPAESDHSRPGSPESVFQSVPSSPNISPKRKSFHPTRPEFTTVDWSRDHDIQSLHKQQSRINFSQSSYWQKFLSFLGKAEGYFQFFC